MNWTVWTTKPDHRWQYDEDLELKYEIIDVLGGGGMGRVLRARHRQLKRLVAIKLLQHDLKASEAVTRFLREARAAAQIRSVHVAHVMDAGILRSGQPYIVMEYLQGQDLANMVSLRGRLPVEQGVGFVLQALEAIAEAHVLGIIHRDIKPGNLFATRALGGETSIKVVDFGLAKTNQPVDTLNPSVTERGAVLGTPSYMSPEQFVDAQDVDARADIWGIGATLFELLTGTPPFTGSTLPQIYTAVMHQPIPALRRSVPDLPEALERVVAKCLTRERDKRFANVADLAEALGSFAGDASRESVARIRRITDGVRESLDSIDVGDELTQDLPPVGNTPVPKPGLISSTFARAQRDLPPPTPATPATPTPVVTPKRRKIGIVLIAVLLAGMAAWTLTTRRSTPAPPSETRREAARVPLAEAPPPKLVESPPPVHVTESAPVPVIAASPIDSPAAPKSTTVTRPTAKRPRKTKVAPGEARSMPPDSIYEQYP